MNLQQTTNTSTLNESNTTASFAISQPRLLLSVEGLAMFVGSILVYAYLGGELVPFILLLLLPDVGMVGYLFNKSLGATIYNVVHTITGPVILALVGLATANTTVMMVATIWMAHIGMDRMVGYGLKYAVSFKDTHLGRV